MGVFYTATFAAVAVSAAQDLFEIVAGATTRVAVHEISFGQYSDFGDAAAETLSVKVIRGYTTSGSGGAAVTPAPLDPYGSRTAVSTVERNNTTQAADGTAVTLFARTWNIAADFVLALPEPIILAPSSRLVVAITVPADAITMNGTILFEELGKMPVS